VSEWRADGDCVWGPVQGDAIQLIAQLFDGDCKANARLIAAAPDLLEACKAGLNALYDIIQSEFATTHEPHRADADPDIAQLRAAIEKATGGAK
jgi:hypothetical protein